MSRALRWHILTGEYPPKPGGVSDYTHILAGLLAASGDEVHVWTGHGNSAEDPKTDGVTIHHLPGQFCRQSLRIMDSYLRAEKEPFRLLIQYTPHMYGYKAMNLFFANWIRRSRRLSPWMMFHEVSFGFSPNQPFKHRLLAHAQNVMARWISSGMTRCFVSIPQWGDRLKNISSSMPEAEWLPIGSNVPESIDTAVAQAIRNRIAPDKNTRVLAHFGTYGAEMKGQLRPVLSVMLGRHKNWIALMVGRGSDGFAGEYLAEHPEFVGRIQATGSLAAEDVAAHLIAADVSYQPYLDGISSRRGSAMAGLALGIPIVTNSGVATESAWKIDGLVVFADTLENVERELLTWAEESEARKALCARARSGYQRLFSWKNMVERLRADWPEVGA